MDEDRELVACGGTVLVESVSPLISSFRLPRARGPTFTGPGSGSGIESDSILYVLCRYAPVLMPDRFGEV